MNARHHPSFLNQSILKSDHPQYLPRPDVIMYTIETHVFLRRVKNFQRSEY